MKKPEPDIRPIYDWIEIERYMVAEHGKTEEEMEYFRAELHDMFCGGNGVHVRLFDSGELCINDFDRMMSDVVRAMDVGKMVEAEISW